MAFVARTSETSPSAMANNPWWYSTGNIYYPQAQLPNCTCYAYGRYAEIRNGFANLPGVDAGEWFDYAEGFNKGVYGVAQPQLGCVICFGKNPGSASYGHVAIVEEINYSNGEVVSIKTSNSGYGGSGTGFFTEILDASQGYISSWMQSDGRDYYCQGFIYNDAVTPAVWHAKQRWGYDYNSLEGADNASMIIGVLVNRGWSTNAAIAAAGNSYGEGGLNPWRWQGDYISEAYIPTYSQFLEWMADSEHKYEHGYGLYGWTAADRYINATNRNRLRQYGYAPNFKNIPGNPQDGEAQTVLLDIELDAWAHGLYNYYNTAFSAAGVDINSFYWITMDEFKTGIYSDSGHYPSLANTVISLDNLVGAFMLCWEKPGYDVSDPADLVTGSAGYYDRCDAARYFSGISPTPPTPPTPTPSRKMPLWMMLKPTYKYF